MSASERTRMALDHDSLIRLLLSHRAMLIGYIDAIVRDSHLAEDVFQEVALVVLRKGGAVEEAAGFPAWARTIARFEALNAVRRAGRAPQLLDDALLDALDRHWTAGDGEGRTASVDALRACLDKLAPHSRKLVELRYGANVSGRDLASRLAQPLNTVYVTLSRIHRALSACVKSRLAGQEAGHA